MYIISLHSLLSFRLAPKIFQAKLAVSGSKGKDIKEEFRRLPFKVLRLTFLGVVLASGIVGSICSFR